jgi:glycosyltransferase involved in cell wall biosynthesis
MDNLDLKTLFVSHTYTVGVNQGKLDAIARTKKFEVGLLVPERWKAKGWKRQYTLEKPYSNISYYPSLVYGSRGGGYWYPSNAIKHAIADFNPNILHVEQEVFSLSAFQMAWWSRKTSIPLVLFVWENLDRRLLLPRRWMSDYVLKTARLIVAGNQDGKAILRKWGYHQPIEVMPQMGVDPSIFSPHICHQKTNKIFHIGYMGRLIHRKGLDTLLAALHELKDTKAQFHVTICGSGIDAEKIRQEAIAQQVDDLICWQDLVSHSEVPQVMGQFDALVLPSRTMVDWKEQFGHVLIEAMSMGIPVVGSSCGEIPHVIGRSDLVFHENDASALAKILFKLIQEPDWHQQASQYGLNRVLEHYTHDRIATRLVEIWQKVLQNNPLSK